MVNFGLFALDIYVVWLVVGFALCAAETLVPGAFLIWIGAAALAVGVVEFFLPLALTPQLLLFAALVVALVFVGKRVYGSLDAGTPQLPLSRAHALIGKEFFLDEAIVHGFGRIRVGDSVWRVAGEDLPAGAKVRVVAVEDGAGVRVEKA
ncbi:MAG: NfeD family protein [Roseiarcus sp.]|jgi:membrane protein implicated in regulation of membrane protease activity